MRTTVAVGNCIVCCFFFVFYVGMHEKKTQKNEVENKKKTAD